ncbi:MAG: L-ribulose-5-phosphate 4-epimerase AraD [Fimbriimonadia bacterium]
MQTLKERVWEANRRLHDMGLVVHTWGNASARDPETGLIAIKPSGVSYGELTPALISIVRPDGEPVEGGKPSSDTPTHLVLYREFQGIGGIVHTHSPHATAWAQARKPIPCLGTTHADHFFGEIPVTDEMTPEEIAGDYEANTGEVIVRCFAGRDPLEMPAVLVAAHGPFAWGATVEEAVLNASVLEQVARIAAVTLSLRPDAEPIDDALLHRHFLRKHGPDAYYGQ